MELRFSVIIGGAVLLIGMQSAPAKGENKIQAFVNSNGRVIFTNVIDSPRLAPAPVVPETPVHRAQEVPDSLDALVDSIAANHGVDSDLVKAVIQTESNFNRFAVSNKGARGLMQLMPGTGQRYGVRDFFDPEQNIEGGVRYLKFLLDKFNGNLDLSLAAYNAGENLVQRLGRIPYIPETVNYVRKVRDIYKTKSTPAAASAVAEAKMEPASAPEPPRIFRMVDARGVVYFSNVEPPN